MHAAGLESFPRVRFLMTKDGLVDLLRTYLNFLTRDDDFLRQEKELIKLSPLELYDACCMRGIQISISDSDFLSKLYGGTVHHHHVEEEVSLSSSSAAEKKTSERLRMELKAWLGLNDSQRLQLMNGGGGRGQMDTLNKELIDEVFLVHRFALLCWNFKC